jgi:hypothetical protein
MTIRVNQTDINQVEVMNVTKVFQKQNVKKTSDGGQPLSPHEPTIKPEVKDPEKDELTYHKQYQGP